MTKVDAARAALLDYRQADEDGVMVLVSRQAIHEVVDELDALREALSDIARQKTTKETEGHADFEYGYDACIQVARRALGEAS